MSIKRIVEDSRKSISVFFDITKFIEFPLLNTDISRTQGMCHLIQIVFGTSLSKV